MRSRWPYAPLPPYHGPMSAEPDTHIEARADTEKTLLGLDDDSAPGTADLDVDGLLEDDLEEYDDLNDVDLDEDVDKSGIATEDPETDDLELVDPDLELEELTVDDERGAALELAPEDGLDQLDIKKPAEPFSPRRVGLRARIPRIYRRGWVVVVVTILVVAVAVAVAGSRPAKYSANSILLVNPGATATNPGSAQDAQALAATYAELIPNDQSILNSVSSETGLSPATIKSGTAVTVINGTSLLEIKFTNSSAATVALVVNDMSQAISKAKPVTASIPSGAITIIQGSGAVTGGTLAKSEIVLIGLILGILLGVIVVITWERADPRFDKPEQLTTQLGLPARALGSLNTESATALVERWKELADREEPTIALVSAVRGIEESVVVVGRRLEMVAEEMHLVACGAPGEGSADILAHDADLTVLVVPRESRIRDVLRSRELLRQLGVQPSWALMVNVRGL